MHKRLLASMSVGVLVVAFYCDTTHASLIINRNFTGGVPAPGMTGGGTLQNVFGAAADWWEMVYCDPNGDGSNFELDINFSWHTFSNSNTLGDHLLTGQGGTPNRQTSARIRFANTGIDWFADSTPFDDSEFTNFSESSADLGAGLINTGRVFSGATGDAAGQFDLFSVALHEIGHALGLSSGNIAYNAKKGPTGDITVTSGPWDGGFAGTVIPGESGTAHLSINTTLMYPFMGPSTRKYGSAVDILANAEISEFHNPKLDAQFGEVPEPATIAVWSVIGLFGAGVCVRRKRAKKA